MRDTRAIPPYAAWEKEECEVVDAGDAGETDQMGSITEGIGEQILDKPMSEKAQGCVEVVRLTPHKQVQRWTAGHMARIA